MSDRLFWKEQALTAELLVVTVTKALSLIFLTYIFAGNLYYIVSELNATSSVVTTETIMLFIRQCINFIFVLAILYSFCIWGITQKIDRLKKPIWQLFLWLSVNTSMVVLGSKNVVFEMTDTLVVLTILIGLYALSTPHINQWLIKRFVYSVAPSLNSKKYYLVFNGDLSNLFKHIEQAIPIETTPYNSFSINSLSYFEDANIHSWVSLREEDEKKTGTDYVSNRGYLSIEFTYPWLFHTASVDVPINRYEPSFPIAEKEWRLKRVGNRLKLVKELKEPKTIIQLSDEIDKNCLLIKEGINS